MIPNFSNLIDLRMKKRLRVFWGVLCLLILPWQVLLAQPADLLRNLDRVSSPLRQSYLVQTYGLTFRQAQQYETLLAKRAADIQRIDERFLPGLDQKAEARKVSAAFKQNVKNLFGEATYTKWVSETIGSERVRIGKEALGMNQEHLNSFWPITEAIQRKTQKYSLAVSFQ